jgi:hypothetical protein
MGAMSEREELRNVVELLLREPEIRAWLEADDEAEDDDDYEPPRAA